MLEIKIFTHPDHACYTFVFFAIFSVFTAHVIMKPELELSETIKWLFIFFGLVVLLLFICKLVGITAKKLDGLFDN